MQQPHLGPDDIDFLLDGDEGFASYPIRKHLEGCADCRAELERARDLNEALERLPVPAPGSPLADRVMARVQVFEPWHVALVDSARRLVPHAGPWRAVATAGAFGAAISVSAIALWVTLRLDLALYAAQLGWTRVREAAVAGLSAGVSTVFGDAALSALQTAGGTGGAGLAIFGGVLLVALVAATLGLRGLVATARRGRSQS
jgi:hypothetical protein